MSKLLVSAVLCTILLSGAASAHELLCRQVILHGKLVQNCASREAHRHWHAASGHCRQVRVWDDRARRPVGACS